MAAATAHECLPTCAECVPGATPACVSCAPGYWGEHCARPCAERCAVSTERAAEGWVGGACDRRSGACDACESGWHGERCDERCPVTWCVQRSLLQPARSYEFAAAACSAGECERLGGNGTAVGVHCTGCVTGFAGSECEEPCGACGGSGACNQVSARLNSLERADTLAARA